MGKSITFRCEVVITTFMSNCVTIGLPEKTGLITVKLAIRTYTCLIWAISINNLFLLLSLFALCFKSSTSPAWCCLSFLQVVTPSTNCTVLNKWMVWFIFCGFKTHYVETTKTRNYPGIPTQFIMSCHCLYTWPPSDPGSTVAVKIRMVHNRTWDFRS